MGDIVMPYQLHCSSVLVQPRGAIFGASSFSSSKPRCHVTNDRTLPTTFDHATAGRVDLRA